jgi:serine/threonine protein kinase
MAPEILDKRPFDPILADVWALGVTFFEMATGRLPWEISSVDLMKQAIRAGRIDVPPEVPAALADAIRRMVVVTPTARCRLQDIVQMEFFKPPKRMLALASKAQPDDDEDQAGMPRRRNEMTIRKSGSVVSTFPALAFFPDK